MIEIKADIGDPVQFVAANTELVEAAIANSNKGTHLTTGTEYIISDDLDVEVAHIPPVFLPSSNSDDLEILGDGSINNLMHSNVASSLGSLYQYLYGDFRYEQHTISISAYPSAGRVNLLASKLGSKPGVDVPAAHTVVNRGEIKRREFVDLLSQKKHPRGVKGPRRAPGVGIFHHDRNSDHTPGSLWIPPTIAQAVFDRAGDVVSGYKPKFLDRNKAQLTAEYDNLTMRLSRIASLIMNENIDDKYSEMDIDDIANAMLSMSIGKCITIGQGEMVEYLHDHFNTMKRNTLALQALGFSAFQAPVA
jgi:hypothetical protein